MTISLIAFIYPKEDKVERVSGPLDCCAEGRSYREEGVHEEEQDMERCFWARYHGLSDGVRYFPPK